MINSTMSFTIESYILSKPVREVANSERLLSDHPQGTNWPVVYILHGNKEIYIGETNNANERLNQHLDPHGHFAEKRQVLNRVEIVFDSWFNKSAILDIENALISLFRFEISQTNDFNKKSRFFTTLQNSNRGQSKLHNYYNRAHYQDEIELIWEELRNKSLATNPYHDIVNDILFKYSPYTALNEEQQNVSIEILNGIMDSLEADNHNTTSSGYTAVINGAAGTGKTIVLINMLVRLVDAMFSNQTNHAVDNDDAYDSELELGELSDEAKLINRIRSYVDKHGRLKVAYVAQMTSLRNTMGTILKGIPHLHKKNAIGPNDVVNQVFTKEGSFEPFDILFIDEAHRLWQYNNIGSAMGSYVNACRRLYGCDVNPREVTTLDWLCKCSRSRVIVYDSFQTVKDSDITPSQFKKAIRSPHQFELRQQMRCRAGADYIAFVNKLFEGRYGDNLYLDQSHYDFRIFNDPNCLIDEIVKRNAEVGLSKCATGYGWQWERQRYDECSKLYQKWLSENNEADTRKKRVLFYLSNLSVEDGLIQFGDKKYVRNLDYNWILEGDPQEIGCIHTSQGYDLNYVGVLLGPEIDYSSEKGIFVKPECINDKGVRRNLEGLSSEERCSKYLIIKKYVVNAYKVMMERGIKGCYIYAHNVGMKEYLNSLLITK